jgi:hypothetical protein
MALTKALQQRVDRVNAIDPQKVIARHLREYKDTAYAAGFGELSAGLQEAKDTMAWLLDEIAWYEKHLAKRDEEAAKAANLPSDDDLRLAS